jgi:hypothetical protein
MWLRSYNQLIILSLTTSHNILGISLFPVHTDSTTRLKKLNIHEAQHYIQLVLILRARGFSEQTQNAKIIIWNFEKQNEGKIPGRQNI